MKKTILIFSTVVLAAFLGACTSSPKKPDEEAARLHALVTADAERGMRCLSLHQYDSVTIVSDQLLLFKGSGKRVWANALPRPCPGMHKDDVLVFDLRSSQVCSLDWVTATRPGYWGWPHAGPKCSLGEFIEFDMEVLQAVDAGLPKF